MYQEKCTLTCHNYLDNLKDMMKDLRMNHNFSDVTFVTEDKKHIKAHKNILSACSPVLKDLITFDDQSNSLIDLSDIHSSEFESVMQFIYFGEATFNEERVNEFLNVTVEGIAKLLF